MEINKIRDAFQKLGDANTNKSNYRNGYLQALNDAFDVIKLNVPNIMTSALEITKDLAKWSIDNPREMMNNRIYVHVSKKGNLLGFFTTKKASNDILKQNSGVTVEIFENIKTSKKQALNIADVSGFSADDMLKMALFINEQAWCKSSKNGKWVSMYDDVGCEDDEFVEMWTDNYR